MADDLTPRPYDRADVIRAEMDPDYDPPSTSLNPPRSDDDDDETSLHAQLAEVIRGYDWDHGVSANPEVSEHQRGEADAVMAIVRFVTSGYAATTRDYRERAEQGEAEVERLRAIITSLDCATAERDAAIRRRDQAENRAALYRQQVADLKAHRDVLIDEVKTLQGDLEAFGEAQKAWVQFRRERDALKAATEQAANELRDVCAASWHPYGPAMVRGLRDRLQALRRNLRAALDPPTEETPDAR